VEIGKYLSIGVNLLEDVSMSNHLYLIANWKMHMPSLPAWTQAVAMACVHDDVSVVLCPPYTMLAAAQMVLTNTPIALGAQDCHAEASGAYTGDVSSAMLRRAGCHYVIVGHSERRQHHGDTDAQVVAKAKAAIEAGVTPILCIGESHAERESGKTLDVLKRQLSGVEALADDFLLAYEPVWAIGSGLTPSVADIASAHGFIKKQLNNDVPVVYGGSVKPANAPEILGIEDVDGVLVGGASLEGEDFARIVLAAASRREAT